MRRCVAEKRSHTTDHHIAPDRHTSIHTLHYSGNTHTLSQLKYQQRILTRTLLSRKLRALRDEMLRMKITNEMVLNNNGLRSVRIKLIGALSPHCAL